MARRTTTYAQYAQEVTAQLLRWRGNIRQAYFSLAIDAYRQARQDLSGPHRLAALRAFGHPYGRGATTPRGRRRQRVPGIDRKTGLPINVQSGRTRRALTLTTAHTRDTLAWRLRISAPQPYHRFLFRLGGTRRMIGRNLWDHVQRRWRAARLGVAQAAATGRLPQ